MSLTSENCANCCTLKKEVEMLKKSGENFLLLKQRIISTDDIIRRYQSKLAESANRSQQINELRKQVDILKLKCESAEEQMSSLLRTNDDHEKAKKGYEERIARLDKLVAELTADVDTEKANVSFLQEQLAGKNQLLMKSESFDNKMRLMEAKVAAYGRERDDALMDAAEAKRSLTIANGKIKNLEKIINERRLTEDSLDLESPNQSFVLPECASQYDQVAVSKKHTTSGLDKSSTSAAVPSTGNASNKTSAKAKQIVKSPPKPKKRSRPKSEKGVLTAQDWLGSVVDSEDAGAEKEAPSTSISKPQPTLNAFISDSEEDSTALSPFYSSDKRTRLETSERSGTEDLPALDMELLIPPGFESILSSVCSAGPEIFDNPPEPMLTSTQLPEVAKKDKPFAVSSPPPDTSLNTPQPVVSGTRVKEVPFIIAKNKPKVTSSATELPLPELSASGLLGLSDLSSSEDEDETPKKSLLSSSQTGPQKAVVSRVSEPANPPTTTDSPILASKPAHKSGPPTSHTLPRRPEPRHRTSAASAIYRNKTKLKETNSGGASSSKDQAKSVRKVGQTATRPVESKMVSEGREEVLESVVLVTRETFSVIEAGSVLPVSKTSIAESTVLPKKISSQTELGSGDATVLPAATSVTEKNEFVHTETSVSRLDEDVTMVSATSESGDITLTAVASETTELVPTESSSVKVADRAVEEDATTKIPLQTSETVERQTGDITLQAELTGTESKLDAHIKLDEDVTKVPSENSNTGTERPATDDVTVGDTKATEIADVPVPLTSTQVPDLAKRDKPVAPPDSSLEMPQPVVSGTRMEEVPFITVLNKPKVTSVATKLPLPELNLSLFGSSDISSSEDEDEAPKKSSSPLPQTSPSEMVFSALDITVSREDITMAPLEGSTTGAENSATDDSTGGVTETSEAVHTESSIPSQTFESDDHNANVVIRTKDSINKQEESMAQEHNELVAEVHSTDISQSLIISNLAESQSSAIVSTNAPSDREKASQSVATPPVAEKVPKIVYGSPLKRPASDLDSLCSSPPALAIVEMPEIEEEPPAPVPMEADTDKQADDSDSFASSPGGFVIDEPEEVAEEQPPAKASSPQKSPDEEVEEGEITDDDEGEEEETPALPDTPASPPVLPSSAVSFQSAKDILEMPIFNLLSPVRETRKKLLSIDEIMASVLLPELLAPIDADADATFKKPAPRKLSPRPAVPAKVVTAKPSARLRGIIRSKSRPTVYSGLRPKK